MLILPPKTRNYEIESTCLKSGPQLEQAIEYMLGVNHNRSANNYAAGKLRPIFLKSLFYKPRDIKG